MIPDYKKKKNSIYVPKSTILLKSSTHYYLSTDKMGNVVDQYV